MGLTHFDLGSISQMAWLPSSSWRTLQGNTDYITDYLSKNSAKLFQNFVHHKLRWSVEEEDEDEDEGEGEGEDRQWEKLEKGKQQGEAE